MDNNEDKLPQLKLFKLFLKLFSNHPTTTSPKTKNSKSQQPSSSSQSWVDSNINQNEDGENECQLSGQRNLSSDSILICTELSKSNIFQFNIDTKCYILEMADELLISICSGLSINDLIHLRLTSKRLYGLCNDMSIWKGRFVHVNTLNNSSSFLSIKPKRPTPRLCPSSILYDKYMYVYGGDNGYKDQFLSLIGDVKNDLWRYNLESRIWEEILYSGMKPKLTEHTSVLYNGKIIMFGGSTGCSPQYSSIVYQYDINLNSLTVFETKGNGPSPRSAHTAIVYNDNMYVFGGWDGCKSNNKLYSLDLLTKHWSLVTVSGTIPHQRRAHCSLFYNHSLYLFGGFDTDKPASYFNSMFKLDLDTCIWEELKCGGDVPSGRSRSSMIEHKGKFYLYGGWDRNNYFQEIHEFDAKHQHWTKMSYSNIDQMESIGLGQNCSVIFKDQLITFGGYTPLKKASTNEIFSLRLE
ncbi:Kelch repeat-containing protein [Cavenderia fasciculata]|uniref:Kelch repeat-containing protein n=1 Tax=Cavenderia fasciculata TaxID=261658 RepID=F4QDA7_CACFS|nr:Kelch repeat-containing protein [Cavenderia fasciculata]EGG13735.1 Kelch repeat-containing protein [Cavenderia fasciculata]|eukprot:XP_004350439.1 Kelch repeat-containing protein [Cavenderia fasciculata]